MVFETAESNTVVIAVIGGVFSVLVALMTGLFAYRGNREMLKAQDEADRLRQENEELSSRLGCFRDEIDMHRKALELKLTLGEWSRVQLLSQRLFMHAQVERILFFRGWNGRDALQFATAVHQIRSDRSVHYDYIHYPVGETYNMHLALAEKERVHFIKIDGLDAADEITQLYHGEIPPISETAWSVLKNAEDDEGRAIKTFVSISTFSGEGYTEADRNLIRRVCYEMQGIFEGGQE
ncbi:MAG TPA: hypothetical protein VMM38_01390 [Aridibacter sp.]|nr:hypothetical protein [Aridibacter sp.]